MKIRTKKIYKKYIDYSSPFGWIVKQPTNSEEWHELAELEPDEDLLREINSILAKTSEVKGK